MRETVLVVDDEPLARMDIAQTLNDAGFDVLEASNSEDALEHVKACQGDIAAIITDIATKARFISKPISPDTLLRERRIALTA